MSDKVVDEAYLEELKRKASLYDKMVEDRRRGARTINNIPKEELRKRATAAALARWGKKG